MDRLDRAKIVGEWLIFEGLDVGKVSERIEFLDHPIDSVRCRFDLIHGFDGVVFSVRSTLSE